MLRNGSHHEVYMPSSQECLDGDGLHLDDSILGTTLYYFEVIVYVAANANVPLLNRLNQYLNLGYSFIIMPAGHLINLV